MLKGWKLELISEPQFVANTRALTDIWLGRSHDVMLKGWKLEVWLAGDIAAVKRLS